ncbi:hypothetical protein ACTHAM_000736 [Cellulomonas soli]|uniref:hypothetical protein n=1 Tax=Cellulomonas soli TaxID=931535 RepID=UPI003F860560
MARLSILDRFRPVGAPGPAGPLGVPATTEAPFEAELAPVFAALSGDLETCRRLVDDARQEADGIVAEARARATAVVAEARLAQAAARAEAAEGIGKAADEQDARTLEAARAAADRLQAAGTARLAGTAQLVVDRLLADHLASRP